MFCVVSNTLYAQGHIDVDGASVVMEPCAESIAAGDGRELWQYLSSGQIASVLGKKCISVGTGNLVMLKSCDASSSSQWEAQGSGTLYTYISSIECFTSPCACAEGQLRSGHGCLSMKGLAAGTNVALRAAVSASSSADTGAHGASMAVDGSSSIFWVCSHRLY